jgi:hypothetical protein
MGSSVDLRDQGGFCRAGHYLSVIVQMGIVAQGAILWQGESLSPVHPGVGSGAVSSRHVCPLHGKDLPTADDETVERS